MRKLRKQDPIKPQEPASIKPEQPESPGPEDPESLVGWYFHSDVWRGWHGLVAAEPAPGTYLVVLMSWEDGEATHAQLVRLADMAGWHFYDNADWMAFQYEHGGVRERWERQREPVGAAE